MNYLVYGPFRAPRFRQELSREEITAWWSDVEEHEPGLAAAIGVYVFSLCFGDKYVPWYVGKTNAAGGFRVEIFQPHKREHYISSTELKRGAPALHLIAKVEANRGNFARSSQRSGRDIDALETALIAMALHANPKVRNSKKTWFIRNCYVPGIFGEPLRGKPPESVVTLRRAFDL